MTLILSMFLKVAWWFVSWVRNIIELRIAWGEEPLHDPPISLSYQLTLHLLIAISDSQCKEPPPPPPPTASSANTAHRPSVDLTLTTMKYFCINQGLYQFEIIINALVSSFCFIWICYGYTAIVNSFSAGIVFIRNNLTYSYVRFWRIKTPH